MAQHASVLTSQEEDFPRWYQEIIAKAEVADNGPVRGTMVIRPYGYGVWELMQEDLNRRIKAAGASNAYFPLFIPQSHLQREADHVEGFSPELAVVTVAGGKELDEPVVVRPTSETIIGQYMAKWVQSYRDLPLLLNQWANVVRWELRPRLFLRTTEFLWQEGHTAHQSEQDAAEYSRHILTDVYADFMRSVLSIPVFEGRKTTSERFAGATNTLTCEAMTRDGKALQMGTSHELGQNFSRAFDVNYLDTDGLRHHVWTTSWGTSTRMLGGVIMVHGDDQGLRLPPKIAPIQCVVVAVKQETMGVAGSLVADLNSCGIRARLDGRVDSPFGRRIVEWELKGVPFRVEVGPRDLSMNEAVVVQRSTGKRERISLEKITARVAELMTSAQSEMLQQAERDRDNRVIDTTSIRYAVDACEAGNWARLPWSDLRGTGESRLAESAITVRCLQSGSGQLPVSANDCEFALVARAY